MKKALMLLVVLVLTLGLFALAGCGNDNGDDNGNGNGEAGLSGRYVLSSMTMDGEDQAAILELGGVSLEDIYIEFAPDGNFTMALDIMGTIQNVTGTYTVEGNTINLDAEDAVGGSVNEGTIDGNTITFEDGWVVMTFEKQ